MATLHVWLGLTFKTTLLLANITSIAWLCIYHGVLPAPKAQAVSQLHTLNSRDSSASTEHSQTDVHGPAVVSRDAIQDLEGSKSNTAQVSSCLLQQSPRLQSAGRDVGAVVNTVVLCFGKQALATLALLTAVCCAVCAVFLLVCLCTAAWEQKKDLKLFHGCTCSQSFVCKGANWCHLGNVTDCLCQ